jgi:hypothetical protein
VEESLKQLWTLCIWFFGISTTVTLGLFGWLINITSKINVGESIIKNMNTLVKDVDDIKNALIGDYDKKGLVTRHYELEKRVEELEINK